MPGGGIPPGPAIIGAGGGGRMAVGGGMGERPPGGGMGIAGRAPPPCGAIMTVTLVPFFPPTFPPDAL